MWMKKPSSETSHTQLLGSKPSVICHRSSAIDTHTRAGDPRTAPTSSWLLSLPLPLPMPCLRCIATVEDRVISAPGCCSDHRRTQALRSLSVSNINLVKKKYISKLIVLFFSLWLLGSAKPRHIPLVFCLIFLLRVNFSHNFLISRWFLWHLFK